jgi:hypothetical protein
VSRAGEGFLSWDPTTPTDSDSVIAVSRDGDEWFEGSIASLEPEGLELLTVGDGFAVALVGNDDRPRLLEVALGEFERSAEFRARPPLAGEWSPPVLAPALAGTGFVGLVLDNGVVRAFESLNGLDWSTTVATDLPFGFSPTRLEIEGDGYRLVGRAGLVDTAAFTSPDGVSWTELPLATPGDYVVVDMSVAGSNRLVTTAQPRFRRAQRCYLHWTDASSDPVALDAPPDAEIEDLCWVAAVATEDGLIGAYRRWSENVTALASWTPEQGWREATVADVRYPERLRSAAGEIWYLTTDFAGVFDPDAGVLDPRIDPPQSSMPGAFIDVSADGSIVVYQTDRALYVGRIDDDGRSAMWREYPSRGIALSNRVTTGNGAAIYRVTTGAGSGLMRFPAP